MFNFQRSLKSTASLAEGLVTICSILDKGRRNGGHMRILFLDEERETLFQVGSVPPGKAASNIEDLTRKIDALARYPDALSTFEIPDSENIDGGGLRFGNFLVAFSGFDPEYDEAIAFVVGTYLQELRTGEKPPFDAIKLFKRRRSPNDPDTLYRDSVTERVLSRKVVPYVFEGLKIL